MNAIGSIIEWLLHLVEDGVKAIPRWQERRRRQALLLEEFQKSPFHWLTLRRLTKAIGLDPAKDGDLDVTVSLLVKLPAPGPARPDLTPPSPDGPAKPRMEELWGLKSKVG